MQRYVRCRRAELAACTNLHVHQHTDRCTNQYRNANADSDAYTDSAYGYGYRHIYTKCDSNGFSDTDANLNADANADTAADYANQHTNTHIQPDLYEHAAQERTKNINFYEDGCTPSTDLDTHACAAADRHANAAWYTVVICCTLNARAWIGDVKPET